MIYKKTQFIPTILLLILFILIVANGGDYGIDKRFYIAEVIRVDVLDNHNPAYSASIYTKVINTQNQEFYTDIAGPVIERGQFIKISCTKRLITRGLICQFESTIENKEVQNKVPSIPK